MTPGSVQFKLTYEISPIMMTGGLVGSVPGATVPLISFTEGGSFTSILGAGAGSNLDNFFAYFLPMPGSRLSNYAVGQYPFANQSVAANAIITSPLSISMIMIVTAKGAGDMRRRQAIITGLKQTLDAHVLAGGLFTIATPNYLYKDCILTNFMDVSAGETKQPQYRYQLDFIQPLVSKQEAQQSYNNMMAKINSQTQWTPGEDPWSTESLTPGNPASGAAPAVVPETRTTPSNGFSGAQAAFDATDNMEGGFGSGPSGAAPEGAVSTTAVAAPTTPATSAPSVSEALATAAINVPSAFGPGGF